jgi:hypothetical protein
LPAQAASSPLIPAADSFERKVLLFKMRRKTAALKKLLQKSVYFLSGLILITSPGDTVKLTPFSIL